MFKSALVVLLFLSAVPSSFAMPAGWYTRESRHFIIYYRGAEKDFVDKLIKRSESYYQTIPQNLGLKLNREWEGQKRSKIYVYDNAGQYQLETGQPEWSDGSSIQKLKVIFSFTGAKKFLDYALPHELAHIIFREAVGFENKSVPIWMEEGIASSQENSNLRRIEQSLKELLAKGLLPSLERLQEINPRSLKDKSQIDLFYGQVLSVVDYLISRDGRERFGFFCRGLGRGEKLEKALFDTFRLKNIQELDLTWRGYLKEK